ncbi:hypothetical protein BGZ72_010359, partial [Mortierella alpina]
MSAEDAAIAASMSAVLFPPTYTTFRPSTSSAITELTGASGMDNSNSAGLDNVIGMPASDSTPILLNGDGSNAYALLFDEQHSNPLAQFRSKRTREWSTEETQAQYLDQVEEFQWSQTMAIRNMLQQQQQLQQQQLQEQQQQEQQLQMQFEHHLQQLANPHHRNLYQQQQQQQSSSQHASNQHGQAIHFQGTAQVDPTQLLPQPRQLRPGVHQQHQLQQQPVYQASLSNLSSSSSNTAAGIPSSAHQKGQGSQEAPSNVPRDYMGQVTAAATTSVQQPGSGVSNSLSWSQPSASEHLMQQPMRPAGLGDGSSRQPDQRELQLKQQQQQQQQPQR